MPAVTRATHMSFVCPQCDLIVNAPRERAGKRFQCPHCKNLVPVPERDTLAAAATPESFVISGPSGVSAPPATRVILVGVDVPMLDLVVTGFKWSAVAFVVSLAWMSVGFVLWMIVRSLYQASP